MKKQKQNKTANKQSLDDKPVIQELDNFVNDIDNNFLWSVATALIFSK